MFGLPARPWFYNSAQPAKKERRDWNRWFDNILSNQRERIVKELDVEKVLSPLLYKKVFSWEEYLEVVSCREQAASLLEKLTGKGPGALAAFCSILEEVCPHWLLPLLLDAQGGLSQTSLEETPEKRKMRRASEMDSHDPSETSDMEGNSLSEDPLNHPFNKHRSQEQEFADSSGNSVDLFKPVTSSDSNSFLQQEGASSNKMAHSISLCYSIVPGEERDGTEQAQPQRPGCLRDRRGQLLFQSHHGPEFSYSPVNEILLSIAQASQEIWTACHTQLCPPTNCYDAGLVFSEHPTEGRANPAAQNTGGEIITQSEIVGAPSLEVFEKRVGGHLSEMV